MKTLYLKDSSNRRKEFALTTKICIENGKKFVIKEACFPEGIPHFKRIVDSQRLFAKYYKNVKISKTWIENDKLYAEFIDGKQLSDYYIKAIQNNDREEIIKLLKYHVELMLGQDNTCIFSANKEFTEIFGETSIFDKQQALVFTFFEASPENIIFLRKKNDKPYFIDYEWFFDFPIPVDIQKFRIAQQLSMFPGIDDIISLKERLLIIDCKLTFNNCIILINKFFDYIYKESKINYLYINKNFEKSVLQYPYIVTYYGTLYFDTGNGYSEEKKIIHSFMDNEVKISCQIPDNTILIRLDPIEGYGCVVSNLEILSFGGIVDYKPVNGYRDRNDDLVFINNDPQIELHGAMYWLKIKYNILPLSNFSHFRVFDNYIYTSKEEDILISERDIIIAERNDLNVKCDELINERDKLLKERSELATKYPELNLLNSTLYFDTGKGYSEERKIICSFTGNDIEIYCQIPENAITVRLDPIEGYGCIISNLEILSYNGIITYKAINGYINDNGYIVFANTDPQIELYGAIHWVKIKYRIVPLPEISYYRVLNNFIGISQQRDGLINERNNLVNERDGLINERNNLVNERNGLINERDGLLNSRSWRFTKPLRNLTAFIRRHEALRLFLKGLLSLKRNGIIATVKKIKNYKRRQLSNQLSSLEKNVISNTLLYESEYQEDIDFSKYEPKVKAIAFYLPQFHRIPENDKWWGKNFTEWTNTRKAKPRFNGHYQPREPHNDIGYYNLTNIESLKKQVKLAKQHGIYGFCFYMYWFSGKRLLEKPLDLFLEHQEIDINFCLCWANENWTRRWDGQDNEILIKQNYSDDDPYKFIEDIKKYIIDKRYIKIDGIPIILVYNSGNIPNIGDVFNKWKEYADKIGIGKIKILITNVFGHSAKDLSIIDLIDGEVDFPPNINFGLENKNTNISDKTALIFDYKEFAASYKQTIISAGIGKIPLFRTCMLAWDNAARKVSGWTTFTGFSLKVFYEWVSFLVNEASKNKEQIFFINAWNEWAEGTYLEPDKKYGYANINTFSRALCELPFKGNETNSVIFVSHDACKAGAQLLALNIIKQLKETFGYDVYTILRAGGLLVNEFKTVSASIIILDEIKKTDLINWINSIDARIAICNTVVSGDILQLLTEYGINCISLIHEMEGIIRQCSCEDILTSIARNAKKIIFASNYVRKNNEKITLFPNEKVIIRPQGLFKINPYINNRKDICLSIKKKHDIPEDCKIILGVGYDYYRKGIDLFVQCMLKVCNKYNNVYFIWVGAIEESKLLEINNILKENEHSRNFIAITEVEKDPLPYYAAADIYLLTSREDPFPSVVLEAMYSYLPVIAFENGGGYVEIVDNNTGGLVPMENIESMSEFTIKLLNDDDLRMKIGKYAHNLITEKFNFIAYIYFLLEILGKNYKKISVIIPNYNYEKYLRERIESVLSQTYPVFEIIILDDNSTDNSLEIINEYENKYPLRVKSIINDKNSGNVFEQWAKGIEIAKGDYIWIAEADDLSETTFLEAIIKKMSLDENIVMGYTQSKTMDEHGNITGDNYLFYTDKIDTIWESNYTANGKDEIEKRLSVINTILNVSAVVFKNVNLLNKIKYAKEYSVAGDWRFYVDLLKDGGMILFIADSLNIHRRHTNSVTKALNAKKHFDEICNLQDYIYSLTKNSVYYEMAKKYREEVKEYLKI
jgi:O-antigen biosynthesis protein